MNTLRTLPSKTSFRIQRIAFIMLTLLLAVACKKDDDEPAVVTYSSTEFNYVMHEGQVIPSAPYGGTHDQDLTATMSLQELANGNTTITVTLDNTISGETYHIHAHDAADPASTPNGTPYTETPNSNVLTVNVDGNGGMVSVSQEAMMSYADLISIYEGFFVVHDPLQAISTTDFTSFLVVSSFARQEAAISSFDYAFNTGQIASAFAYSGSHANDLSARIIVKEVSSTESDITVIIFNTMDGETYHTHAHDVADPTTTPNGTPYNETPNGGVFISPIDGNGGVANATYTSSQSRTEIIESYEGFFVIHDPLQAVTTTDPTTYVILGSFAR